MGGQIGRRAMLRALGLGAAGLSLGGLELVASCTSSDTTVRPYDPKRPYWEQGNFAAVTTEETVTDLEVTGTIPPELSGLFVRNGSNPPTGTSLHWFLGDGMVHGVRLERGRAS